MKKAIDIVSPKCNANPEDVAGTKPYHAAAITAANKIRNDFLNLASLIDMENAKEPADLGLGVDQSNNGKKAKDCQEEWSSMQ